jgi:hypothetical protein
MAGFYFAPRGEGLFHDATTRARDQITRAFVVAVASTLDQIRERCRADIARAGNFGARWTQAFTVDCKPTPSLGKLSDQYEATVFFRGIHYGHVHEFGATIRPKGGLGGLFGGGSLLWIPLSFANVPKSAGGDGKMTAQEYGLSVSKLFRVDRKNGGAPLLLDIKERKPRYFGVSQVTTKPRFHIREICREVMGGFQKAYNANLAS